MCGIVGITFKDETGMKKALNSIKHRGPDNQDFQTFENLTLGHVRLSIQDTSKKGNQPFFDKETNRWIIFNGEIYNFKTLKLELNTYSYISESDTEVILKAYDRWGEKCVNKFNGMWSFCIYDPNEQKIFLSRDRFGQKPLYYTIKDKELIFASEIKAILHWKSAKLNEKILSDYIYFDFLDHTNSTFFEEIKKIPAGHNAIFNLKTKKLQIKKYYHLKQSKKDLFKEFEKACILRTISDVPISLSLSGGVDSSSIGAIYATKNYKIEAFTTTSKSGVGDERKNISKLLEKYPDTFKIHEVPLDSNSEYIDILKKIVWHLESPVIGNGVYTRWKIAQAVRKHKFKIVITGEGADEMLGGYSSAYPYSVAALIKKKQLIRAGKKFIEGKEYFNLRNTLFMIYYTLPKPLKILAIHIASKIKQKRLGLKIPYSIKERLRNSHFNKPEDYFEYGLYRGGVPQLLNYNDKIPMAHGVESRAPFMDPNLVERLMSYKTEDRVGNGYTKYIFRKEMEKIVPKEIIWDKHKIGFQSPTEKYRKDLINYLRKHKSGLCAKDPAKMSTPELIKLASFTMWKELFLK